MIRSISRGRPADDRRVRAGAPRVVVAALMSVVSEPVGDGVELLVSLAAGSGCGRDRAGCSNRWRTSTHPCHHNGSQWPVQDLPIHSPDSSSCHGNATASVRRQ